MTDDVAVGLRQRQAAPRPDWPAYLAGFHTDRAGITDDVLEHAVDTAGRTPYDRLAEALLAAQPPGTVAPRVLDLACGSAPMASRLAGCAYLGVDLSSAELHRAHSPGVPVLQGDVTRLQDGTAFACTLATADAAERLLRSLYLPDVAPERVAAGRRVVRRWAGTTITTPVRLLTARAGA